MAAMCSLASEETIQRLADRSALSASARRSIPSK
jgi:hypothetical protein